jgi:Protein kinase domain
MPEVLGHPCSRLGAAVRCVSKCGIMSYDALDSHPVIVLGCSDRAGSGRAASAALSTVNGPEALAPGAEVAGPSDEAGGTFPRGAYFGTPTRQRCLVNADLTQHGLDGLRDRYALERELGRGGMATVYLARDLRTTRPVALKVLQPELALSLGPARFLREIRLAARLDHPAILPVLDSGNCEGQLWYTMPYLAGGSLRQRLQREPQLAIP